jgi:hypothetical protein
VSTFTVAVVASARLSSPAWSSELVASPVELQPAPPASRAAVTAPPDSPHTERLRLEALRYAVNEETAAYPAIMRTFTGDFVMRDLRSYRWVAIRSHSP